MNWFKSLWFVSVVALFVQPMIVAQNLVSYRSPELKKLPVSRQVEVQERVPGEDPLKTQEISDVKQESNSDWVYCETDHLRFEIDVKVFGTPKLAKKSYKKYLKLLRENGLTDIQLPDLGDEANGWPDKLPKLQFPILCFREKNLFVIVQPHHLTSSFSHRADIIQPCSEPINMKLSYGDWLQTGQQFAKHFLNYIKRQNEEGSTPAIQQRVIPEYSASGKEIIDTKFWIKFLVQISEIPTVLVAKSSFESHKDYIGPQKPTEVIKNPFVDEAKIQPSLGGICTRKENVTCCVYSSIIDKNGGSRFNMDYSKDLIPYMLEFIKEMSK